MVLNQTPALWDVACGPESLIHVVSDLQLVALLLSGALSFQSFCFGKKKVKGNYQKHKDLSSLPNRPESLGEEGENAQEGKEILSRKKARKSPQTRKGRTGLIRGALHKWGISSKIFQTLFTRALGSAFWPSLSRSLKS